MLQSNRIAFKEWTTIVEILGRGGQILILRKGGIHEKGKRFDVAHDEFFLFPTFEHQNPKDLTPDGQKVLAKVLRDKPKQDVLPIRYYCVVEGSFWISDKKTLEQLKPFHLWSWECVEARYEWGQEKGLFGIVVRIYSLPETVPMENLKRYGGCRSWVELEKPLETDLLNPVLPDNLFEDRKQEILSIKDITSYSFPSRELQ